MNGHENLNGLSKWYLKDYRFSILLSRNGPGWLNATEPRRLGRRKQYTCVNGLKALYFSLSSKTSNQCTRTIPTELQIFIF